MTNDLRKSQVPQYQKIHSASRMDFLVSIKIKKEIILLNEFITQKQKVKEPIKLIDFKLKPKAFAFE